MAHCVLSVSKEKDGTQNERREREAEIKRPDSDGHEMFVCIAQELKIALDINICSRHICGNCEHKNRA